MYSSHCDRYLHVCETFSSFWEKTDNVAIMCPTVPIRLTQTAHALLWQQQRMNYGSHVLKNQAKHEINQISFGEIF
jgi:hypothetical protein